MAWFRENFIALLALIVAVGGLVAPLMTALIDRRSARSNRFTSAIEHLKDDSLSIRMGALFELKKLGLESRQEQTDIVRILSPFVRKGIETKDNLLPPKFERKLKRPNEDIFLACEIASLFWEKSKCSIQLVDLQAEQIDVARIHLKGANLRNANFIRTRLFEAHLEGANLEVVDCTDTELWSAHLVGTDFKHAWNLTAMQLLKANISNRTHLDPDLRAEYDRLIAEREADGEKEN